MKQDREHPPFEWIYVLLFGLFVGFMLGEGHGHGARSDSVIDAELAQSTATIDRAGYASFQLFGVWREIRTIPGR